MRKSFVIDCFPESAHRYTPDHAIIAIDVIRATTTAVTAVAAGWRCFPVPSPEAAYRTAARREHPLLCGELGGLMPDGFDRNNSRADLCRCVVPQTPVVLLSSSGTRLIHEASRADALYLACFRNFRAVAGRVAAMHARVAILGAGSRNQFREEDQMCCAWIGDLLLGAGYVAGSSTMEIVERWRGVPVEACAAFRSAEYLRRSGQQRDLDFVLSHVNDLSIAFAVENGEVVPATALVAHAR